MSEESNIPIDFLINTYSVNSLTTLFKNIFKSIEAPKASNTIGQLFNKEAFYLYFKYPLFIAKAICDTITSLGSDLSEENALNNLASIYSSENIMKQLHLITCLLSFNRQEETMIETQDIILFFNYLDFEHLEEISDIIRENVLSSVISSSDLEKRAVEANADVIWLVIIYLNYLAPFCKEDIEYFSNSVLYHNAEGVLVGQSRKLKLFLRKRFENELLIINLTHNGYSELFNNDSCSSNNLNINSSSLLSTVDDKVNVITNEEDDLGELDSFEVDLSNVISTSETITHSNNSQSFLSKPSLFTPKLERSSSSRGSPAEKLSESINETSRTHISIKSNKRNIIVKCSSFSKSCTGQKVRYATITKNDIIEEMGLDEKFLQENYFHCKYSFETGLSSTSVVRECKALLTPKNAFFELAQEEKEKTMFYKYERAIPLKLITAQEEKDSSNKPPFTLKFESWAIDSLKNIKLHFLNKTTLTSFMNKMKSALKIHRDIHDDYNFIEQIGKGSYSEVFLGKSKTDKTKNVAIKQVSKQLQKEIDSVFHWEEEVLLHLSKATHPNIVKVYAVYESETHYYYVTEYIKGISLSEYILRYHVLVSVLGKLSILKQLASGIDFLHQQGIMHRDIKPDNVILDLTDKNNIVVKIIDFGFAKITNHASTCTELLGTLAYMAPEIISKHPYSFKIDIWSFGVIAYQTLFGLLPFGADSKNIKEMASSIMKGIYCLPQSLTTSGEDMNVLIAIIKQCLVTKVENRSSKAMLFPIN